MNDNMFKMKNNKPFLIILVILFLIVGAYLLGKNQPNLTALISQQPPGSPVTQSSVKVIDNSLNEDNTDQKYTIKVKFPQIEGLQNTQAQTRINQLIKDLVTQVVDDFKQVAEEFKTSSVIREGYAKGVLDVSYDIVQANNSIVSIQFNIYEFTGGAHGMVLDRTFNYDVSSNKPLQLKDLFRPNTDYLERLSELSIKDLLSQAQPNSYCPDCAKDSIQEGASPKEDNFKLFTLENDRLVLIFNPYQVASYAEGQKRVKIPYRDIQDLLDPGIFK